jgi:hypothetical protein
MKQVMALIAMAAALSGCSSSLFGPSVSNTLPGSAPATVTPVTSTPIAAPLPSTPAGPARLDIRDQGLLDADRSLANAVLEQGLGAGLAGFVEADATVLTPSGAFVGPEQIRAGLRPGGNAGQLFWVPEKASSGASADYGSTSGRYVQVLRGAEAVQGRYVSVWRRDTANRWRIVSTTAMPVRVAAPAPAPTPAVAAKPAPKPAPKAPAKRIVRR